jgi:glutaredoxin
MSITKSVKLYFFNEREKYEKNKKSLIAPKLVTNKDIRWTNRKIREHGGSFNNMVS